MKNESMEDSMDSKINAISLVMYTLIGVLCIISMNPLYIVPAGNVGILLEFGQAKAVMQPGLNFIIPLVQAGVLMDVRTLKLEADASAASKDLQSVKAKLAVNYRLVPDKALEIYKTVGAGYSDVVLQPAVQESLKANTALYSAESLITNRESVKDNVEASLQKRMLDYGVVVESVSIVDFDFSDTYNQAIEMKQKAEQEVKTAQNELLRAQVDAEKKVAEAQGVANSTLAKARAEAESLRIQKEQLRDSPEILQLRWIEKWNGVLPTVTSGGSSLLLSVDGMLNHTG